MISDLSKYGGLIKKAVIIAVVLLFIYIFIAKLLVLIAPFLLAFIISTAIEPLVTFLEIKLRFPRRLASMVSLVMAFLTLGVLIVFLVIKGYREAWDLAVNITNYVVNANRDLNNIYQWIKEFYVNLPPDILQALQDNLLSLSRNLSSQLTSILKGTIEFFSQLPKVFIFILVTMVSSYFISSDIKQIRTFIYNQIPQSWRIKLYNVKTDTFTSMVGYLKALFILMTLTFFELAIGLSILNTKYAIVLAAFICLVDALPILGTGTVLVPWALWNAVTGNFTRAMGLFVLYIVILAVRQLVEPKIVSKQVGLHPLVTTIAMYVGLRLWGIPGLFIGPITMIFLKSLQKSDIIKLWNNE